MVDSPSDRTPTMSPRWDLADTEGYGGGNISSVAPWMFSWYVVLYRRKKYVGGRSRGPGDRGALSRGGRGPTLLDRVWAPEVFLLLNNSY